MGDSERQAYLRRRARLSELARRLPSLEGAPGIDPLNSDDLMRWAADPLRAPIELVSAQFVLAVADPMTIWDCGIFDLDDASLLWDEAHHRVFAEWARDYWFVSGWEVPLDEIVSYPPFKRMSREHGEPVSKLKKRFAPIFRKTRTRNLAELGRLVTVVRLLSRGGTLPRGEA